MRPSLLALVLGRGGIWWETCDFGASSGAGKKSRGSVGHFFKLRMNFIFYREQESTILKQHAISMYDHHSVMPETELI